MRRLLLVFLAILLPLQFAWAGAAAYCAHEGAPTAAHEVGGVGVVQATARTWHFGHHSHVHHGDDHAAGGKTVKLPDADCAACHFPGSHGVFAEVRMPADYRFTTLRYQAHPHAFGSIPAPVPDRPQWPRLA